VADGGAAAARQRLIELGLPERLAMPAQVALGIDAAEVIAGDPWAVLAIPGVRPEQADSYARSRLGAAARPEDDRRKVALVRWLLSRAASDGHTVLPMRIAEPALAGYGLDASSAADAATRSGTAVEVGWPGGGLALPALATAEQAIAQAIGSRQVLDQAGAADWEPRAYGPGQEVPTLAILTGPAGRARDSALASRVEQARAQDRRVRMVAPTLGGAMRLSRLVSAESATVAEAIAGPATSGAASELLVVDDADSLDVETMADLLGATAPVRTVLLLADPHGLPPLDGPGAPLRDLHDWLSRRAEPRAGTSPPGCETPSVGETPSLGAVPSLAAIPSPPPAATIADLVLAVGDGRLPRIESHDHEVAVVPAATAKAAVQHTIRLLTDAIPRAFGIAPKDIMVLGAARHGLAGTDLLNAELKARLNPGAGPADGLDIGDRVVFARAAGRACPGDVGIVEEAAPSLSRGGGAAPVDTNALTVDVGGEHVHVSTPAGVLQHARALTVARGATGRWPAAVVVLPGESAGYLSSGLLRTAFSRAERHLSVVHGAGPNLARAAARGYDRKRRTMLGHLLGTAGI
jgi:AAA domain/Helix-hairpin-helix containing domain